MYLLTYLLTYLPAAFYVEEELWHDESSVARAGSTRWHKKPRHWTPLVNKVSSDISQGSVATHTFDFYKFIAESHGETTSKICRHVTKLHGKNKHRVKWRHSNLQSWYDLHVVRHNVVLCKVNWWRFVDLFKWNLIVRFKKNLVLAPDQLDLAVSAAKCLYFLAIHHGGQNSWHRQ